MASCRGEEQLSLSCSPCLLLTLRIPTLATVNGSSPAERQGSTRPLTSGSAFSRAAINGELFSGRTAACVRTLLATGFDCDVCELQGCVSQRMALFRHLMTTKIQSCATGKAAAVMELIKLATKVGEHRNDPSQFRWTQVRSMPSLVVHQNHSRCSVRNCARANLQLQHNQWRCALCSYRVLRLIRSVGFRKGPMR